MAKKQRYYVVWVGKNPGIYTDWEQTKQQITGIAEARYKAYDSLEQAQYAYSQKPEKMIFGAVQKKHTATSDSPVGKPNLLSVSVDAACSGNPGVLEYQGVDTATKRIIFKKGPFPEGTVNLGEFLAVVHALALLKKNNSTLPIYSDSKTALAWLRNKKIKTTLERKTKNAELFDMVDRALLWLQNNNYPNQVLKWETEHWGENPADFGRK
jgi:ribonuclease HI